MGCERVGWCVCWCCRRGRLGRAGGHHRRLELYPFLCVGHGTGACAWGNATHRQRPRVAARDWRKGGGRGGRLPEEKAQTARGVPRHAARAFRHDGDKKNYRGSGVGGRGRGAGMCALVSQWSARGSRVTGPPTAVGRGDRQLASWRPRSSRCAPQSSLSRPAGPMGQFRAKHTILGTLLEAGPARPLATRS